MIFEIQTEVIYMIKTTVSTFDNIKTNDPSSVKRGLNAFAKSIYSWQPMQSTQADMGKKLSWSLNILHVKPFHKQTLVFTCLQYKSFKKTWGKGEIARNEQFLLFPQCFLPVWRTFFLFHQIRNCHLQTLSVWKSLRFVLWEKVKGPFYMMIQLVVWQKRI